MSESKVQDGWSPARLSPSGLFRIVKKKEAGDGHLIRQGFGFGVRVENINVPQGGVEVEISGYKKVRKRRRIQEGKEPLKSGLVMVDINVKEMEAFPRGTRFQSKGYNISIDLRQKKEIKRGEKSLVKTLWWKKIFNHRGW
jgi:hypothetical protein